MSHAAADERAHLELPRQFVTAWLHIMSALMYCLKHESWRNRPHVGEAHILISEGMDTIIKSNAGRSLLESAAILPMEVLSLISAKLLMDQVGKADDISETYSQYLNSLVCLLCDVMSSMLTRVIGCGYHHEAVR